jgi:release factor glutamine methyltransferase
MRVRVSEAVARAAEALAAAGVASPRADAELLAAHVLDTSRGRLALAGGFDPAGLARFEELVARRATRVPLQHLTGTVGFGRLELAVGPGAFIPRPETELLAQWAVGVGGSVASERSSEASDAAGFIVVDLGSGTGALALSIAHELPAARVYAVERSPAALAWLRRNAADRATAGDRPVEVVAGDATDPAVLADLDGTVDLVVCNPPYVPEGVPVPPEVAAHDPPAAVFAGPDGLAVIRPVVARAAGLLRPGGWFGLEHDQRHGEPVSRLLGQRFTDIDDHRDLAGRPRYVTARRVAD